MSSHTTHKNSPRLLMGLCLLAAALCLLPGQAALAQNPAPQESRYCTWLFWSKEPALIKQALERMAQGDPFMVVARDLARKSPKDSQANADCMQAAGMDPAVLAVVRNLQIGEISRPFDLGGGTALVMRTTDQYRRKAQEYYSKGRYSQAERELLRDLKLHPASAAAWHMLALTRTAQGNYKLALTALDKALAWSPGNPAMLNDKASALANLGRAKEAVTVFEKALQLDPKNPTIMSNLAWALTLTKQKPKRAEALAQEACQVAPREARYWHTLGKIKAEHGKHGEAVISLRQALILEPNNKAARLDVIKSIKALDPKVLARLSQAAPPPAAKPEPKPEPKSKDKADEIGKGLKRVPDLSGPPIALPSQWPSLPKAKAAKKPEVKTEAKAKSPQVTKAKPEAKPEPTSRPETKPEPPTEPSSGASGRIVSLPMPKFPEQPPQPPDQDKEADAKENVFQESPKPAPAKADSAAEAETGVTGQDKPKPATAKPEPPKPEPEKPMPGTEPGKTEPVAKAKPDSKAKPGDDQPEKAKAATKAAAKPEKAEERDKAKSEPETKPAKDEPEKAKDETKPAETKAAAKAGQVEAPAKAKADTKSEPAADKPGKNAPTYKADVIKAADKPEADATPKPAKDESGKSEPRPVAKAETKAAPAEPKPGPKEPIAARPQTVPEPSKDVKIGKPHYLIQVASYRPESLAAKELRAWQGRKMSGHIEKWQDKRGRTWHRVLLGPFADEKEAEKKAKELKAKRLVRDYYVVKRPAD